MSTLKVEMIDIHAWDAEESPEKRKDTREKMRVEIEKSVRANDGNPGFIKHTAPLSIIWDIDRKIKKWMEI